MKIELFQIKEILIQVRLSENIKIPTFTLQTFSK